MHNNDLSSAQSAFEKALTLDPDLNLAIENLKQLYELTGNKKGLEHLRMLHYRF